MACCHDSACSSAASPDALNNPIWRRALWIALIINAAFFVAEIVAGEWTKEAIVPSYVDELVKMVERSRLM